MDWYEECFLKDNHAVAVSSLKDKAEFGGGMVRSEVSPKTILRPRFEWSAVQAWLEEKDQPVGREEEGLIPMARGYFLGKPRSS